MPDGMRRGGGPGWAPREGRGDCPRAGCSGAGYPRTGYPRERRFPRFFFSPIYYGAPYNRRDYIDRPRPCRDSFGRCNTDNYGGRGSNRRAGPGGRDTAENYGRNYY